MDEVQEEEKKIGEEVPTTTAEQAFGKPTEKEVKAEELEKKQIDESIAEARAAAQACLNSDLFKDYAVKFAQMEKWLIIRFKQIDAKSPYALVEFIEVQRELEVLGALMGSVKLDAGAKIN